MIKKQNFKATKLEDVERDLISNTMKHCLGDSTKAANILGISIVKLQEKLENYPPQKEFS